MTDAKYVLCRWKKRLWPAKVLARTKTSTKNKRRKEFFLDVQILSLEEKIQVKSTDVEALQKSHIENLAAFLASQKEVSAAPLEELTYRRSLRVALDTLNEGTSLSQGSPMEEEASSRAPPLPCGAGPADSAPERQRDPAQRSLSGVSTCERQHERTGDLKKGVGRSEDPGALLSPSAGGASQNGGERGEERERPAGSRTTLALPSRPRADDHDPGAPSHCSTVLLAPEGVTGWLTKRPRLDGELGMGTVGAALSPKHGPLEHMTLHCAAEKLSPPPSSSPVGEASGPQQDPGRLEEDPPSPEESMELNKAINSILEEDEEDEEPPRILLYHEPRSFEVGMLVWLKYQKYPFWPAVVKSVRRRDKKASVLFIEGDMNPKGRGITVSLRRLKHFDCKEKQTLLDRAKEDYGQAIGWCVSLITDYRVRLGCGSFTGSFLEYYAADLSYPVRKSIQQDALGTRFPQLSKGDPEEPTGNSLPGRQQPCRKVLPDRSRAARDRANQKLVEYIVKAKGAESHLRAVLKSRRPSRWLKTFLSSSQYVTCVETYLEDEEQLDLVVRYLQGVYQDMDGEMLARCSGDRIRFILDVLLPEAIICAISAVDAVDYKTAEEKYIRGPSLSYREKEIFDNQLLEERNRRRQ